MSTPTDEPAEPKRKRGRPRKYPEGSDYHKPKPPGIPGRRKGGQAIGSSQESIDRWERDAECVRLRRAEVDWDTIVEKLGYSSRGHAHDRFTRFMREYPRDDVETMRDLELDKIERKAAQLEPECEAGNARAIEVWNKLSERRSKLMGLDKPERKELTVITAEAVDAEIEKARAELQARQRQAIEAGIVIDMPPLNADTA